MSDIQETATPLSDHVARFWRYLETETVRILLDLKRTVGLDAPDGPIVYWDGSSFSDDVAKSIVAERRRLTTEIERLTADRDNSNRLLDECRHERNVLQKICAERADENERLREALTECAKASYLDEYELEFKPTPEALIAQDALRGHQQRTDTK